MKGYQDRIRDERIVIDGLNHILGSYIAVGINDPKKYPKKPLLSKDKLRGKPTIQTAREMASKLGVVIK